MFRTRTQRISFEQARRFIREGALEHLGRSEAQEEHYSREAARLRGEWRGVADFIVHDKFGFSFVEEQGRKEVPRPWPDLPPDQCTRLSRNDHPYFFEDDVEHWVLWKLGSERVTDDELQVAVSELQEDGVLQWTSFQNPPALMSIPEVQHAHIILQRPQEWH